MKTLLLTAALLTTTATAQDRWPTGAVKPKPDSIVYLHIGCCLYYGQIDSAWVTQAPKGLLVYHESKGWRKYIDEFIRINHPFDHPLSTFNHCSNGDTITFSKSRGYFIKYKP